MNTNPELQLRDSSQTQPTPLEIDKMYGISTNTCTNYGVMHKIMINGHLYKTFSFE